MCVTSSGHQLTIRNIISTIFLMHSQWPQNLATGHCKPQRSVYTLTLTLPKCCLIFEVILMLNFSTNLYFMDKLLHFGTVQTESWSSDADRPCPPFSMYYSGLPRIQENVLNVLSTQSHSRLLWSTTLLLSTLLSDSQVAISLIIHGLSWTISRQVKAHVVSRPITVLWSTRVH